MKYFNELIIKKNKPIFSLLIFVKIKSVGRKILVIDI